VGAGVQRSAFARADRGRRVARARRGARLRCTSMLTAAGVHSARQKGPNMLRMAEGMYSRGKNRAARYHSALQAEQAERYGSAGVQRSAFARAERGLNGGMLSLGGA